MFQKHNSHGRLFDFRVSVNDRKKKKINTSWVSVFQKVILPVLIGMEDEFSDFLSDSGATESGCRGDAGNSAEIKHLFDLTNAMVVANFIFHVLWHQVLNMDLYDCNLW